MLGLGLIHCSHCNGKLEVGDDIVSDHFFSHKLVNQTMMDKCINRFRMNGTG